MLYHHGLDLTLGVEHEHEGDSISSVSSDDWEFLCTYAKYTEVY